MLVRIISGVIGSVLICVALFFNTDIPIIINVVLAIASLLCSTELLIAKKMINNYKLSIPCMLFASAFPILVSGSYWAALVVVFTVVMFSMMIFFHNEIKFEDLSFIYLTVLIATIGTSSIVMLCDLDRAHTGYYVTLALVVPWVADAGAYFIGSFFGKRKLCPDISPKKTIEGAIGGIILGVLGTLLHSWVFMTFFFKSGEQIQWVSLTVIALICTCISIIGDLSFSIIKRYCHIKDYGNIIPGHGGILDRFDSVIFSSPVMLVFVIYFPVLIM